MTFSGTIPQLVVLTQHAHDIIRTLDPSATILSPSIDSWGYSTWTDYFAAGGTQDIDASHCTIYPNPNNDIAETLVGTATHRLCAR